MFPVPLSEIIAQWVRNWIANLKSTSKQMNFAGCQAIFASRKKNASAKPIRRYDNDNVKSATQPLGVENKKLNPESIYAK